MNNNDADVAEAPESDGAGNQADGRERPSGSRSGEASSPYSTGGGGVTLERRIGALYLAQLLTGDTSPELGDDGAIVSVAFQQAPRVSVDDLVVTVSRPGETEPSVELAIGIRRRPNLVRSNGDAQTLFGQYVQALVDAPDDNREHRLALVVAGRNTHAEQLSELCAHARTQVDALAFFELLSEPGRFAQGLVNRLEHLSALVSAAPHPVEMVIADGGRGMTWRLLRRLWVLTPRVEEPDTTDWIHAQNRLAAVARGRDLGAAHHLLDRLEVLAGQYGPAAAVVDLSSLRREVHSLLEPGQRRHTRAWLLLEHLQQEARAAVRDEIRPVGASAFRVDRTASAEAIIAATANARALVVDGESGVGKSSLVLRAAAEADEAGDAGVVSLNLRHLPERPLDLVSVLGSSLADVLSEMSAPLRLLVVDGADAATESRSDVFSYVVDAAHTAGVCVIAVSTSEASQVVRDIVSQRIGTDDVAPYTVGGLNDTELDEVIVAFPQLARLGANERSRELLRRLVVVDLLVRSEPSGLPMSDVDAMRQVWAGLVRRHEKRDRGLPDAREHVLVRLALRELSRGSAVELAAELDAGAIDGLRQDGLLRASVSRPWQLVPDFAHDEVRRYAVARALLADGDPVATLLAADAPRWALPAARLASQAVLSQPDSSDEPLHGRLGRQQEAFDALVAAGHGARWGDVPSEALLTLGDPAPVLAEAWAGLHQGDSAGLGRLLRLVDQRHRVDAFVDPVVVEPIVSLVLNDETPWEDAETGRLLREWLLALVVRDRQSGDPLRIRLRESLVGACDSAQADFLQRQHLETAAQSAEAVEPSEEEQHNAARRDALRGVLGARTRRRRAPQLARELREEIVVELLALLGPDLGDDGERLLRQVASEAPGELAPAVEELGTGRALASYGHGLLADLVEAYYIDEADGRFGLHDDGVRDHRARGSVAPLSGPWKGPFAFLFQSDLRRGIAVLNRLLNHAARARVRTMVAVGNPWRQVDDNDVYGLGITLRLTGAPRAYFGDDHVWRWYRGSAVGPPPCVSALRALERVCDQLLSNGAAPDRLAALLLDGCENLAMPGLVVGLVVRHIERAGTSLDPFLAEPLVWRLEFVRVVHEASLLAASSEGLVAPERRSWSCREAASWLTVTASPDRAAALRAIGDRLVEHARELEAEPDASEEEGAAESIEPDAGPSLSTLARAWASALDQGSYEVHAEGDTTYVQSRAPEDVEASLQPGAEDLQRGQEVTRIQWRYFAGGARGREKAPPPVGEALAHDLALAEALVNDPPTNSATPVVDMATAIAAHAVEMVVLHGEALTPSAASFVVNALMSAAAQSVPDAFEFEGSYFEQGPDRAAGRALPLLLLPQAAPLRGLLDAEGAASLSRVADACKRLAQAVADETRLHLARGLDVIWSAPCSAEAPCHHSLALEIATESMRDCVLGAWDVAGQRRHVGRVPDPIATELDRVPDDDLLFPKLDAAIRACGRAAARPSCVREEAAALLPRLLHAQRRGLLAQDDLYDHRGTHALIAARALLDVAGAGDDAPLHETIEAYADESTHLTGMLRALNAAAEERQETANAARRVWPEVISQVLELNAQGHQPLHDRRYGTGALRELMPTPIQEVEYLFWEVGANPIIWPDPRAWASEIDAWIPLAVGEPDCVDSLIGLVRALPEHEQASFGLPRVAMLVLDHADAIARGSYLISRWLTDIRSAAADAGSQTTWQNVVDGLVVAGNRTLAPYSE